MSMIVLGETLEDEIEALNELSSQSDTDVRHQAKEFLLSDFNEMIAIVSQEPYNALELLRLASVSYRKILFSILMMAPDEAGMSIANEEVQSIIDTLNHALGLKVELTKMAEAKKYGN